MQKLKILMAACALFGILAPCTAHADNVLIGVNTVGVGKLNHQQQDALIAELQKNGVRIVRTNLAFDNSVDFIINAYRHGIGTVAIVMPEEGSTAAPRPASPSTGLPWQQQALSHADPAAFTAWITPRLDALDAAGVRLAAIEFGNEINNAAFNGDFPVEPTGRVLSLNDLNNPNDAEGRAIASGYRVYLKVLASLDNIRSRTRFNRATPVISAGLSDPGLPRSSADLKHDSASIPATLKFLRQNGIDRLVAGYGVHVYPSSDPSKTVMQRVTALNKDTFSMCGPDSKPCWLTEWGFNNKESCPLDDEARASLFQTLRGAFSEFAAQGRLAAALYYSWSGNPGVAESPESIFRCGRLTNAGRLVLSPL